MLKLSKSEELLLQLEKRTEALGNGERFPSVRQLMKEYEVSQFTIAPALDRLEEQGLICRKVGHGTFVCHHNQVASKKVVLLFPEWPSAAIHDMAKELEAAVLAKKWSVRKFAYDVNSDIFSRLDKFDADAVILDPPNPGEITARQLEYLLNAPVPVVLVRADIPLAGINCVCGNNSAAGIIAADYLMRQGHRKLGLLISEPHVNTVKELVDGFTNCVTANGAELTVIDCNTEPGQDSVQSAYAVLRKWLSSNHLEFSALFVVSDETVLGAYKALAEREIAVPEHLSVMGFGNTSTAAFYHPCLSTIEVSRKRMALAALEIAERCMNDRTLPGRQHKIYPQVVERESVAGTMAK